MLPLQLLRVRTKKGEIIPLFCTTEKELQLAAELISEFSSCASGKEKKRQLDQRLEMLETRNDDFKLVRGFAALLERRCKFDRSALDGNAGTAGNGATPSQPIAALDPVLIRRAIFEESSRGGFALTDLERERIVEAVASSIKMPVSQINEAMWSDMEENMVLQNFDAITEAELVGWYNLSLMQTLLFNCTNLEFTVHGGANWKNVLRNVRRLGLMYNLQKSGESETEGTGLQCSIDGPLSIFKLTEKYGTSIAKLLPSITSSQKWSLAASIVRKTMSGKKIYQFRISNSDVPELLGEPHRHNEVGVTPDLTGGDYDSLVEEKFANKLEQSVSGWEITREPDPLIVSGGKAFIPDFLLEKYGRKVYVEIIGFWTTEYLERKMHKISEIVSGRTIDLFVAINENLACSKISSVSMSSMPRDKIIIYKNDTVPVKVIAEYLREIDKKMIEGEVNNPNLKIKFDAGADVVSMTEIASLQNIALESAIKIAERDNSDQYLKAGEYFISRAKAGTLADLLKEAVKFSEASQILLKNAVPEECHAELIPILGYDVLWKDMDASSAVITRRKQ